MKSNRELYELVTQGRWDDIAAAIDCGECSVDTEITPPPEPSLGLHATVGTRFPLLYIAAQNGCMALAKALLEHGAKPNTRIMGGETALMTACGAEHYPVVDLLLTFGADIHKKYRGETALMTAAHGRKDIVRRLLAAGARVADTDLKGRTALSHACTLGRIDPEMISILLDAGSPVDGRDMHVPIALRELDVVRLLLSKHPNVNARFDWPSYPLASISKGDTPLHVAAGDTTAETMSKAVSAIERLKPAERLAILDLLLTAGADVNAQRLKTGWTPLLLATNSDEPEVAARLIQAGADPRQEFECKVKRFPLSKLPQTWTSKTLSAYTLATMRPRNKRIRQLLLGTAS